MLYGAAGDAWQLFKKVGVQNIHYYATKDRIGGAMVEAPLQSKSNSARRYAMWPHLFGACESSL